MEFSSGNKGGAKFASIYCFLSVSGGNVGFDCRIAIPTAIRSTATIHTSNNPIITCKKTASFP